MKLASFSTRSLWLVVAWSIIVTINLLQLIAYKFTAESAYSWEWIIKYPAIALVTGFILIFIWIIPGYDYLRKKDLFLRIPLFVLHALLYVLIYIYSILLISGVWSDYLTTEWLARVTREFFLEEAHNVVKTYIYLVAVLFAYDYFDSKSQLSIEKKGIESQLNQAKLLNLQSKLQPHFLFNTLHGVVALIDENKKKAQQAIIDLGDLLRFSIDMEAELIPIDQELELLNKYLAIEKARHEDQLQFEILHTRSKEDSFKVPPMLLQPIVENSIKHGFKESKNQLTMIIEIDEVNKTIKIKNNGMKLSGDYDLGVGLKLVQQQLDAHFGDDAHFRLFMVDDWVINEIQF